MTTTFSNSQIREARATAQAELSRFVEENRAVFLEYNRLCAAIARLPPESERHECYGNDDGRDCTESFEGDEAPEGWVEAGWSCGDGGNGNFFCPTHVGQVESGHGGKCDHCSI